MSRKPEDSQTRPTLSPGHIVDVATMMIERDGLPSFTMRSLGRELGTSAMAVYSHFASRDEILCAVLQRFMADLDTDPIPGERWDDTMRRTMTSIYRKGVAHPDLSTIEVQPSVGAEGLAQHTDKIVSLHLAQGMPESVLTQAWALIDAYLTGFTANAIAVRSEQAALEASGTQSVQLSEDEIPLWQRIVAEAYTDEAFAHGVELIIDGIRSLAAPDPCEWYTPAEAK